MDALKIRSQNLGKHKDYAELQKFEHELTKINLAMKYKQLQSKIENTVEKYKLSDAQHTHMKSLLEPCAWNDLALENFDKELTAHYPELASQASILYKKEVQNIRADLSTEKNKDTDEQTEIKYLSL